MNNEIKLGDRVKVSKDAPRMYISGHCRFFYGVESVVEEIEDGNAIIRRDDGSVNKALAIPTKYLVKVDAEAKEAKYRKDDKVCINKSSLKHGLRGEILTIIGVDVSDRTYYVQSRCMRSPIWLREDEISPYVEPTEQTEAKTKPKGETLTFPICFDLLDELESCDSFVSIRERMRKALKEVEAHNKPRYVPKIMFNTEFWVKYEADLAKEVALKVANKFNAPKQAAEYAVSVAKSVVEGLKRK